MYRPMEMSLNRSSHRKFYVPFLDGHSLVERRRIGEKQAFEPKTERWLKLFPDRTQMKPVVRSSYGHSNHSLHLFN